MQNRKWFATVNKVPDFKKPLPVLGNLHHLYGNGEHMYRLLLELTEATERHDGAVKVWFGPWLVYCLSKPEEIKAAASTFAGKPFVYDFAKPWVAEGLVTAPVPVWKRHIKKVAPTFSPTVVDGFLEVFTAQSRRLVSALCAELDAPFRPFRKYLAPFTLEVLCQTAFGVEDVSERLVSPEYLEAFNDILQLMMYRGFNPLLHPDIVYSLTPASRRYNQCLRILHGVSMGVIKKKREAMKSKVKGTDDSGYKDFKAFLDLLMELPEDEAFTDSELRAEIDTLIVGGQETTASTLNFLLLQIGAYPHVQDSIAKELDDIFGDSARAVTREDLRRMVYTEATIKETLRLFPPSPGVMRLADKDLQMDGYEIPAGAMCVLCLYGAGRWRRSWGEDADTFRPERWLQPDFLPDPAAYVPFSYGKRACIGRLYSVYLLKVVLAQLLRTFRLKSNVADVKYKIDVFLRPTHGDTIELALRRPAGKTI